MSKRCPERNHELYIIVEAYIKKNYDRHATSSSRSTEAITSTCNGDNILKIGIGEYFHYITLCGNDTCVLPKAGTMVRQWSYLSPVQNVRGSKNFGRQYK